ncbi:hypothetical protein A5788_19450 [Gordonia sp. 852002-50816_SCH5313054-c]|uniref:TetR/AcrR family transcriptional regulator n=1 Tax=Gordonia TaxID=2053 RepID=UPI0007E93FC2|nr:MULTISPECIES: TetR/AcrR family transcriptional regulator [unclassified Gordonia (in: high G+C Gram-positive bacteria)]OBC05144.1 hypothetical protein A5786_11785 [Gordonia sp. 852002-50816_SCH5313054-a]OBC13146.1 hypothetical protein A5788_19450 [Gordonia sp. 852002-50816_SCH5313054-c]
MAIVNRQDYFDAALEHLAKSGHASLRLTSLCRSLGVTTGSFYNWFKDWNDFVEQFLEYWQSEQTLSVTAQADKIPDPHERLDAMVELSQEIPHDAEVAVRAWSSTDPRVATVQSTVDDLRLSLIERTLRDLGLAQPLAHRCAALGLSIVIGHQHLDTAQMRWSLEQFNALVYVLAAASRDQ